MAKKKDTKNQPEGKFDQMLTMIQNIFILQCLQAGIKVNDIREMLHIDKWRVTNISKLLKNTSKSDKNMD